MGNKRQTKRKETGKEKQRKMMVKLYPSTPGIDTPGSLRDAQQIVKNKQADRNE